MEWGLTSLSPVLSVVINNDDDDSHLYSFVISESFRLSASFQPRYFICSHHNMQYLFLSPSGNLKLDWVREGHTVHKSIYKQELCCR